MFAFYHHEPVFLVIEHDGTTISMVKFISEEKYWEHQALELMDHFTNQIKAVLDDYFAGKIKKLDLPFKAEGTEFEMKVWDAVQKIEYGKTATYTDIAKAVGEPEAARAVGNALNKNKLPLLIPCHRIIGTDGALHGFAGGEEIKQFLLEHEAKYRG